jgi:biotin operon repressor
MPLTEGVLADVLGLGVVHVNRTVQQLRHRGALVRGCPGGLTLVG